MKIGFFQLPGKVMTAPMSGVTDLPYRTLCSRFGAALTVSEMVHAGPALRYGSKSLLRSDHRDEQSPVVAQLLGTEPGVLADAARYNVDLGADIVDINMGCPVRKVCNKQAGSALLTDENQIARILASVVNAVAAPVTVKIRTGPDPSTRNGVRVARIAEQTGIQAIFVHGRTRACKYRGEAEYETIRRIKQAVRIPVIANGDIDSPEKAAMVLEYTGADGVMVGRSARGRPWLFGQIQDYLDGNGLQEPDSRVQRDAILEHVEAIQAFYGERMGVRIARKHISWYIRIIDGGTVFWTHINRIDNAREQNRMLRSFLQDQTPIPQAA
ncbi:MAG: putative tRNA-dihydrouridine synthase [Gammaproteobacteria bacterium]|nr:putative tRNA-dihydrouridine synthase [Gammaproteobacteria bacterium]